MHFIAQRYTVLDISLYILYITVTNPHYITRDICIAVWVFICADIVIVATCNKQLKFKVKFGILLDLMAHGAISQNKSDLSPERNVWMKCFLVVKSKSHFFRMVRINLQKTCKIVSITERKLIKQERINASSKIWFRFQNVRYWNDTWKKLDEEFASTFFK